MESMDTKGILNKSHCLFAAAYCRDKTEGGDGTLYFGSLGGLSFYRGYATEIGWLNEDGSLTELGKKIGLACSGIEENRAYFYKDEYLDAVRSVIGKEAV